MKFGGSGKSRSSAPKFHQNQERLLDQIVDGDGRGVNAEQVRIPVFQSKEEIEQFLSGEYIVCPICGSGHKSLGLHLFQAHSITSREFRIRAGIPMKMSLICSSTKERMAALTKKRHETGEIDIISMRSAPKPKKTAPKPMYWVEDQKRKSRIGEEARLKRAADKRNKKMQRCKELILEGYSNDRVRTMVNTGLYTVKDARNELIESGHVLPTWVQSRKMYMAQKQESTNNG